MIIATCIHSCNAPFFTYLCEEQFEFLDQTNELLDDDKIVAHIDVDDDENDIGGEVTIHNLKERSGVTIDIARLVVLVWSEINICSLFF